ncbi:hypothetical protein, partial [Escherichia coli]|uniref:hypothetical protein n=1 Tax=Escherichia coli TaxID=562 RepID=UPI001BC9AD8F
LFVGKTLLHGDVLMWLMKTLLTSGCTNQRGAGQHSLNCSHLFEKSETISPFILMGGRKRERLKILTNKSLNSLDKV